MATYNGLVLAQQVHPWNVSPAEAAAIQSRLAPQVIERDEVGQQVRYVAGTDLSSHTSRGQVTAAVVVLSFPDLQVAEQSVVQAHVDFPYVPGLLSFRETPPLLEAFARLRLRPDLVLVDGQGRAHPRRFGIACHLGLLLDVPAIGCAKSLLVGQYGNLGGERGNTTELYDRNEVIGMAVRTRTGVTPVYVSIGHRVDLPAAVRLTLACTRGYRLPEPTRLAHQAAGGTLQSSEAVQKGLL